MISFFQLLQIRSRFYLNFYQGFQGAKELLEIQTFDFLAYCGHMNSCSKILQKSTWDVFLLFLSVGPKTIQNIF